MNDLEIEIPVGDYQYDSFAKFCERFGCQLLKPKRGSAYFTVTSDEAINFFWLGCNLNFFYDSGMAISSASQLLKP